MKRYHMPIIWSKVTSIVNKTTSAQRGLTTAPPAAAWLHAALLGNPTDSPGAVRPTLGTTGLEVHGKTTMTLNQDCLSLDRHDFGNS
jgi:hypothetical protein